MKNLLRVFMIVFGSILIFSCVPRHRPHHVPPGHAKKIMKSKSAKHHAPGHLKKVKPHKHKVHKPHKNRKH